MKKRRDQHMLERAKGPTHVRVSQQRRGANENVGRNDGGDWKARNQESRSHNRSIQCLADGMQP